MINIFLKGPWRIFVKQLRPWYPGDEQRCLVDLLQAKPNIGPGRILHRPQKICSGNIREFVYWIKMPATPRYFFTTSRNLGRCNADDELSNRSGGLWDTWSKNKKIRGINIFETHSCFFLRRRWLKIWRRGATRRSSGWPNQTFTKKQFGKPCNVCLNFLDSFWKISFPCSKLLWYQWAS